MQPQDEGTGTGADDQAHELYQTDSGAAVDPSWIHEGEPLDDFDSILRDWILQDSEPAFYGQVPPSSLPARDPNLPSPRLAAVEGNPDTDVTREPQQDDDRDLQILRAEGGAQEQVDRLNYDILEAYERIQEAMHKSSFERTSKLLLYDRIAKSEEELQQLRQGTSNVPCLSPSVPRHSYTSLPQHSAAGDLPTSSKACDDNIRNTAQYTTQHLSSKEAQAILADCELRTEQCVLKIQSSAAPHFSFREHLQAHKEASAAQIGLPSSQIRWFATSIHTCPNGEKLSFSTTLAYQRCTVSLFIAYMLFKMDMNLLASELDVTEHPEGTSSEQHLTEAQDAPSPPCSLISNPLLSISDWAQDISITCGANSTCNIKDAVSYMTRNLVSRSRLRLRHHTWVKQCRRIQAILEKLIGRRRSDGKSGPFQMKPDTLPPTGYVCDYITKSQDQIRRMAAPQSPKRFEQAASEQRDTQKASQAEQDEPARRLPPRFEGVTHRMALVVQIIAEAIEDCLHEPCPAVAEVQPSRAAASSVYAVHAHAVFKWQWCAALHDAPCTSRSLAVDVCGPGSVSLEAAEQAHMRLFRELQPTAAQQCCMVSLFRDWRSRRHALDADLLSASHLLDSPLLPSLSSLPHDLLALIAAWCSPGPSPAPSPSSPPLLPSDLLGMSPPASVNATAAVSKLRTFLDNDSHLFVDIRASGIRPWYVDDSQLARTFSVFNEGLMQVDLFQLWHIAVLKERRKYLFHDA